MACSLCYRSQIIKLNTVFIIQLYVMHPMHNKCFLLWPQPFCSHVFFTATLCCILHLSQLIYCFMSGDDVTPYAISAHLSALLYLLHSNELLVAVFLKSQYYYYTKISSFILWNSVVNVIKFITIRIVNN